MANILCDYCQELAKNLFGGIFVIECIATGNQLTVCEQCKDQLVESGLWKVIAQAKDI